MKICVICNLRKPLTDFYPVWSGDRWPTRDGRRSMCKRCMIRKVQMRRKKNVIWAAMGGAG